MQRVLATELSVVFTTSALGMGINLPNLRWVILYGCPSTPLDLAQQLGRTCRDREKGKSSTVYSIRMVPKVATRPSKTVQGGKTSKAKQVASPASSHPSEMTSGRVPRSISAPTTISHAPTTSQAQTPPKTTWKSLASSFRMDNTSAKGKGKATASQTPQSFSPATSSQPSQPSQPSPAFSSRKVVSLFEKPPAPEPLIKVREGDATHAKMVETPDDENKKLMDLFIFGPGCKRKIFLG